MKPTDFWQKIARQVPDPSPGAAPADPVVPQQPAGPDLSFIPADFVKDGKPDLSAFAAHFKEVSEKAAAHVERPVPDSYEFKIPTDLSYGDLPLPEGYAVALDTESEAFKPLFSEMSEVLKGIDAPAEAAGKMMGLLARYEAAKESREHSAWIEDVKSLGGPEKVSQRAEAIQRQLQNLLPEDQAKALFTGTRISAAGFKALETLLAPRGLQTPTPQPVNQIDPLAARYPTSIKKG